MIKTSSLRSALRAATLPLVAALTLFGHTAPLAAPPAAAGEDLYAVAVEPVEETLVTKNSSVPTLITAFWLFDAVTRGLDRTFKSP